MYISVYVSYVCMYTYVCVQTQKVDAAVPMGVLFDLLASDMHY